MDYPLNQEGRDLARDTAKALHGMRFDQIRTSPLQRAVEFARPIAEATGAQLVQEPRFLPLDFGLLAGREKDSTMPEVRRAQKYLDDPLPGGDSINGWVQKFLPSVLSELGSGDIKADVFHSRNINALIALVTGQSSFKMVLDECPIEPGDAALFAHHGYLPIPIVGQTRQKAEA